MPFPTKGVLETCLYASDLEAAERFYSAVLGLEVHSRTPGRHVFLRCGEAMLLIFDPVRTSDSPGAVGGVPVPAHGATGPGHVAFQVDAESLAEWTERFRAAGIAIEAEIGWPRGGRSIYVRDPAGNSIEMATPDIWDP
jgi:catechol 2,3-dioxygenase-like lactoylglutathione lyase family enzyme